MSHFVDNQEYVIINCGKDGCHLNFAVTREFYDWTMKRTGPGGNSWFCPNGHQRHWVTESEEQRLRRQVNQLEARQTHLEDQGRAAAEDAERLRGQILRDRHRVANGVCPCCSRSFTQLRRHMTTQHPDYDLTRVEGVGSTVRFPCECGASFETLRGLHIHQGHQRSDDWWSNRWRWNRHLTKVDA